MMNRRDFIQRALLASAVIPFAPSVLSALGKDPKNFSGKEVFDRLTKLAKDEKWSTIPIGTLIGKIGMELRGTPYTGSTLEINDRKEVCTVNLLGLDCVTFFESALGIARMIKRGEHSPAAMMNQVMYTRYRSGKIADYTSRLHYTSDWFWDNQQKKTVKIVTDTLSGAEKYTKETNFMSTHVDSYKQLKNNPAYVQKIIEVEKSMNARSVYWIPKNSIADAEAKMQTGDIIGITTTVAGLDCSHTGLCYRDESGVLRFLHASLTKKQVTLDDRLSTYLAGNSKQTGIMVVRPLEPTSK